MIIWESIKLALKAIWAHKLRALLTMLGIIIGITSVVLLISLGEGVKEDVRGMVADLGSNFIMIISGDLNTSNGSGQGFAGGLGNPVNFVSGDIFEPTDIELLTEIDGVEQISPMSIVPGTISYTDKVFSPMILGMTPDMKDIMTGFELDQGRLIDETDEAEANQVIVLGSVTKEQMFGDEEAIGKTVQINIQQQTYDFEVIGTLKRPNTSTLLGSELDTIAVTPYSTTVKTFFTDEDQIFRIAIRVDDKADIKEISANIEDNMLQRHQKEEFTVMTQDDMISMLDGILDILTTFISAIAAISLVVGGIGIMNIMLVSVTERTKEIGLRKAVGATSGAILFQFLMEAIILSILGGLISLGLVRIGVEIVSIYTDISPIITLNSIILSMAVCIGIGLIFGITPAIQAARKDPIDALRYE